ncbi:hypothetical protein vseg_019179 [Gypsophila vaccaria]
MGSLTRTQSSLRSLSYSSSSSSSDDDDNHLLHRNQHATSSNTRGRGRGPHKKNKPLTPLILLVGSITLFSTYLYLHATRLTASENLLILLVFVAVALFYLGKFQSKFTSPATTPRGKNTPVKWFIGDELTEGENETVKEGVEYYTNGDHYEGEMHRGKSNGTGVYTYVANGRYEGEWVNGRYEGHGFESWAKGSRYRGQYRGGHRHGYGVYRFYTGDTYAGQWLNGQYHGVGVQSCCDGSCYVGEFKCGVKHGIGCYHFRNGDRYAGEYFGDKIHGFGVYHFANGHCYEGSWHEGRKQGYGMYTFRNGEPKCGEWNCGSLKTPLPPLTHSVLRAVQAARKAAENAINLPRVDDQVNKAVVGANRAATAARVAAIKAVQNRMDGKFYDTYV